jgi:large subunit ribosomal protein L25
MKTIVIEGSARADFGKRASSHLRNEEMIPCVIYGGGETVHFSVNERKLKQLLFTPNSYIVELDIDGKKEMGVMRETQFHPVTDRILHIDFQRVIPGKPVTIAVPVKLEGNSKGVKLGGKLQLKSRKLTVSALVENLPDELVVDVTELDLGKMISVGELNFENIKILTPAVNPVCAVKATRASKSAKA